MAMAAQRWWANGPKMQHNDRQMGRKKKKKFLLFAITNLPGRQTHPKEPLRGFVIGIKFAQFAEVGV